VEASSSELLHFSRVHFHNPYYLTCPFFKLETKAEPLARETPVCRSVLECGAPLVPRRLLVPGLLANKQTQHLTPLFCLYAMTERTSFLDSQRLSTSVNLSLFSPSLFRNLIQSDGTLWNMILTRIIDFELTQLHRKRRGKRLSLWSLCLLIGADRWYSYSELIVNDAFSRYGADN